MILSDGQIRACIENGKIDIDPELDEGYLSKALTTSALDLRLGGELQWFRPLIDVLPSGVVGSEIVIDPCKPNPVKDLADMWGKTHSIRDGSYKFAPGTFVLGTTYERVALPKGACLAARVEGRSTLARLGIVVHMTAPTIHSGFGGHITLEMYNYGPYSVLFTYKMRICQLVFEQLGECPRGEQTTQYQGQTMPSGASDTESGSD